MAVFNFLFLNGYYKLVNSELLVGEGEQCLAAAL